MKLDLQCQSSHWRPLSYASVSRCQSIPRTGLNNALNAFKAAKCANPRNARFNRMQNKVDHIHSSPLEVLHAGSIKVSIENLSSRFGIDVNGRMAVIKLKDGSLWVHSPVGLDDNLKKALAEIGPVRHVVSPNYEHTKFAKQWQEAFPDAKLYACPGLSEKTEVEYDVELQPGSRTRPEWGEEMEFTCLTYERNPFNRKPFFNEVIFLHKPSRFVMTADLFWNYPSEGTNSATQAWKFGMDRIFAPFYRNFMIAVKDEFQQAMDQVFASWQFDGIIPCHGDVVYTGGQAMLRSQVFGSKS